MTSDGPYASSTDAFKIIHYFKVLIFLLSYLAHADFIDEFLE